MNSRTPSTPDGQSTSTAPPELLLVRFVRAHVSSEWETLLKTKVGLSASASCISNRP